MNCRQKINAVLPANAPVLAVDIGTSGCRATLFSDNGSILKETSESYTFTYDSATGFAHQDPDTIFDKFHMIVDRCLDQTDTSPAFIIIGSMLHSLLLVDEKGRPMAPLSIWADTRAVGECRQSASAYHGNNWYQKTGCPLSPTYPVYRLMWYKEKQKDLYRRFAKALSIKSYIFFRLFGKYMEDYSVASGTGLFDIHLHEWAPDILKYLELDIERLPRAVPVEHVISSAPTLITKDNIHFKGKWVAGASDGPLAHLGSAGTAEGALSLTIGTSGAVRMLSHAPHLNDHTRQWCYILNNNAYVFGIATNNGGNVIDWFEKLFLKKAINWRDMDAILRSAPFDGDLMFIPHIYQERYLLSGPGPLGAFLGLKVDHHTHDLLRAVLEGVVFNMVILYNNLNKKHKIKKIITSGSLAKIAFTNNLLSSLIDKPLMNTSSDNASLTGSVKIINPSFLSAGSSELFEGKPEKELSIDLLSGDIKMAYQDKYTKWKKQFHPERLSGEGI